MLRTHLLWYLWLFVAFFMAYCMYGFNVRERTDCSKRLYWSENRLKSNIMGKVKYLFVF